MFSFLCCLHLVEWLVGITLSSCTCTFSKCTEVHDMWPFGTLVLCLIHLLPNSYGSKHNVKVSKELCFLVCCLYIYSESMKTQHLFFRYFSNMDLSLKILLSSDNCTFHILSNYYSLYRIIFNMHCLKSLVWKQVIWLPIMFRMSDLYFCIMFS